MRLIDADALLEEMKKTDRYFIIVFDIKEAPTVDAVEVVRCKNCACFRTDEKNITYCASMGVEMQPNDFCSYGEN